MKNYLVLSIVFLLIAGGCGDKKDVAQNDIFPYPIEKDSLANGLNLVTVPFGSPGLASLYIVVRVGSRDEVEKGKTGFAHFFEHMMFRGTDKFPNEKYNEELKAIGASANANTWLDRTVYHMTGNAQMLDKMFELESDRFMNLKYSEEDLKVEAGAVKGEYTKNNADPLEKLSERTYDSAFTTHPYSHSTIGYWEDVVDMPNQYQYSLEFFDHYYRPEYSTVVVVGDVTAEQVKALAEKYFGPWKRGNYVQAIPQEPEQTETKYAHLQEPNFPPQLSLNYKGAAFSVKNKDAQVLDLIATMAFSEKAPIYKDLVVEKRKVRSLSAGAFDTIDPGLWSVDATLVDPNDLTMVKNEIDKVLEQLKTTPVDTALLSEAKSRMKYSYAMSIDSPDAIAGSLSWYIWLTDDPETVNKVYQNYESITPEDIMEVAKRYFVDTHLTVATISPEESLPIKTETGSNL